MCLGKEPVNQYNPYLITILQELDTSSSLKEAGLSNPAPEFQIAVDGSFEKRLQTWVTECPVAPARKSREDIDYNNENNYIPGCKYLSA